MKNWKKLAALLIGCAMLAVTGGCAGGAPASPAETAPQTEGPPKPTQQQTPKHPLRNMRRLRQNLTVPPSPLPTTSATP